MTRLQAVWLALAALACAQAESGLRGPISGYVFDERSHIIRPVNGMPGAALLGPPLALPWAVRLAAFAPGLDFALVAGSDDNDRLFAVRNLGAETPAAAPLDTIGEVSRVVWSASARTALVYSKTRAQMQVITGLPDTPQVSLPADAGAPGQALAAMAVNDAGTRIVAAGDGAEDGPVYAWTSTAEGWNTRLITRGRGVSALVFRNADRDVVFANKATNEIIVIRDIEGNGDVAVLAGEAEGISGPVAMASARDGRELWVANAGSSALLVFDMESPGPPGSIPLAGVPSRCDRLDGKSLLLLNDVGGQPLLMLDWAQDRTVFFVPVD